MNDLDLEREIRATFQRRGVDVRGPEAIPPARTVLHRTRRRQLTSIATAVAVAAAVVAASVVGVGALIRSSERRIPAGPAETPSPAAVAGSSCPAGSTPDLPGPANEPRPSENAYLLAATTFDLASGRMLLLSAGGAFWTFDVCTNTWEAAAGPEGIRGGLTELVTDADSDRAIAIERDGRIARVWIYDLDAQTWTEKGRRAIGAVPRLMFGEPLQAVRDPVTGLVLVRDPFTSAMWTYDVDTDTWAEVDQGATLPPVVEGVRNPPVELLAYDASVDRLILYVTKPLGTWEFDIRAGRWEERETNTPANPGFGWVATGEELAYDEANEVSLLFSGGTLAAYDASEHRWTLLSMWADLTGDQGIAHAPAGETTRLYFAMTYDPVNERIVVAGGDITTAFDKWRTTDDVIAIDVANEEWTTLLEPSKGVT